MITEPAPLSLRDVAAIYQDDVAGYYAALRSLAASDGLLWDASLGGWLVLSHRLCRELGGSQSLGCQAVDLPAGARPDVGEFARSIFQSQLMFREPATYQARRAYWGSLLSKRVADDELSQIATALIEPLQHDVDYPDLYNSVLDAFASRVVSAALGIDEDHRIRIFPLVMSYVRLLDGKLKGPTDLDEGLLAVARLYNHLSLMTPPGSEPEGYSRHEWLSDFELTVVAGHVSVAYLLGTIFLQVPRPQSRNRIYLSRLVAEGLRYDSPVQLSGHLLQSTISLQGKTLHRGDKVYLHLGMANRDASQFHAPDRFDASQPLRKSVSWGAVLGSQCPGRALANRSAVAFLQTLLKRKEWLVLDQAGVKWDNGVAGRGFRRLPGRLVHLPDPDDS